MTAPNPITELIYKYEEDLDRAEFSMECHELQMKVVLKEGKLKIYWNGNKIECHPYVTSPDELTMEDDMAEAQKSKGTKGKRGSKYKANRIMARPKSGHAKTVKTDEDSSSDVLRTEGGASRKLSKKRKKTAGEGEDKEKFDGKKREREQSYYEGSSGGLLGHLG
ncbi:hypothetical protein K469DRAFT_694166 [Zopfia rhizophila CBS 207.26]|uniref:Uncharacterized protein n=1 Tax=Zopfia rhizophila CBS 207.26 TaxID=1314779 RepID=A0A6A6DNK6_9PEZI|nr:hypothetical protein K469DRAFT_694166 [Zopfia rhizophila CBS 207.26]